MATKITLPTIPLGMTPEQLPQWLSNQLLPALQRVLQGMGDDYQQIGLLYRPKTIVVADLPTGTNVQTGSQVFVTNESGGAQGASFDGTNWRRFTDRAVVT